MDFDPRELAQADRYKLLIGLIVPRPIAWVSTRSPSGKHNLAPFSFFCGVASEPLSLLFCPANRGDGSEKDTLRNIASAAGSTSDGPYAPGEGGEFVVNVVPHALGRQMAACAEDLAYEDSEFVLAGLTPAPSRVVSVPRVLESPACLECRAERIIRLAPGVPGGGNIVVGRVVSIFVADAAVNARHHIDPAAIDALGRMAGLTYCTTRDRLDIPMGRAALRESAPPSRVV